MKTYLVTNIDYDLDDEVVELPNQFEIEIPDDVSDDEISDYISDQITIYTDFMVVSFSLSFKQ